MLGTEFEGARKVNEKATKVVKKAASAVRRRRDGAATQTASTSTAAS
jgi:hypothetical protein